MSGSIFVYLYPLLSISCVAGYLPQIRLLWLAEEAPRGFSLMTWLIWIGESTVSLGYGVFELRDVFYCLLALLEFVMIALVIMLAVRATYGMGGLFSLLRFDRKETLVRAFARAV